MSADWEDEGVVPAPTLLPIENLELMAAMFMATPRSEIKNTFNGSCNSSYADLPDILKTLLSIAAVSLKEAGCCNSRNPVGTGRDSQIFGIATELTSRIAAKSAAICVKATGFSEGAVFDDQGLHATILSAIAQP